jgi:AraC-like DNA-binding protein
VKLSFINPRAELQPYVQSIWLFESGIGIPASDNSIVAPNGCTRLAIHYDNRIARTLNGKVQFCHEQNVYFVGSRQAPTRLRSTPGKTGFIVVEFQPHGAYPLFGIPMIETLNGLFQTEELFSRWGREVRERIFNEPTPAGKVDLIQQELVALMPADERRNPLVEFCVNALRTAPGRVSIQQLEKMTGYSRRYLDILFQRHVGLSPKVLAEIFRFQKLYGKLAQRQSFEELKDDFFDDYYDQAHFVKEFKRMTGYAPGKFLREVPNQLGRLHSAGGSSKTSHSYNK